VVRGGSVAAGGVVGSAVVVLAGAFDGRDRMPEGVVGDGGDVEAKEVGRVSGWTELTGGGGVGGNAGGRGSEKVVVELGISSGWRGPRRGGLAEEMAIESEVVEMWSQRGGLP